MFDREPACRERLGRLRLRQMTANVTHYRLAVVPLGQPMNFRMSLAARFLGWAAASVLMLPIVAQASFFPGKCTEFTVQGKNQAADCDGNGLGFSDLSSGGQIQQSLILGYKLPGRSNKVTWIFDRIDGVEGGDFKLNVIGVELVSWQAPSGPGDYRQSPAEGSCTVSVAGADGIEWLCNTNSADPAIGALKLRFRVDGGASRRRTVDKELREARFTLAAGLQEGRMRRVTAQVRTLPATAGEQPLVEGKCNTEADALRAAAQVDAVRLTASCYAGAAASQRDRERLRPKAIEWFERAVAQGDADAMAAYGEFLEVNPNGHWNATKSGWEDGSPAERERDLLKAWALIQQSADRGSVRGSAALCVRYMARVKEADPALLGHAGRKEAAARKGLGTPAQESALALNWCNKAVAQGDVHSLRMLTSIYSQGLGVPKDMAKAQALMWKSAELGDKGVLVDIARAYEVGTPDWPRDIPKAIDFYRKAGHENKAALLEGTQSRLPASGIDATVFGIALGYPLRSIMNCRQDDSDKARLCIDGDTGAFKRLLEGLGLGRQEFSANGLRLLAVKVNDAQMDTGFLFGIFGQSAAVDVAVDGGSVVQYLSLSTRIPAYEQVLKALTAKFGPPTRTLMTDWKDPRTGVLVRKTPVVVWALKGLQVHFHAQSAATLLNSETPMGRVDLFTSQFESILQQQAARESVARPKSRF